MKQMKHNEHVHEHNHGAHNKINKWFWIKNITIGLIFLIFIVVNIVEPSNNSKYLWHYGIWFPLTSYIVFWEGRTYLKIYGKMFKGIIDMDTLIGLAAHILYVFSIGMAVAHYDSPMFSYPQMWEGTAVLIVITNIGHALEEKVRNSSLSAYQKLDDMRNSKTILLKGNKQVSITSKEVKVGDVILVKKGELVPLDGEILSASTFDYSNITGESKNIKLAKNQEVISGAYNLGATIKIKVTKDASNSTLSLIVNKIEDVSMARPAMQKIADKVLQYFIPTVLIIAASAAVLWTVIGYTTDIHLPWVSYHANSYDQSPWIMGITAGVGVIAVACPCALGIATPLVYAVSSLLSSENGIMINDPSALEELEGVKYFAFDKTGTITNEMFDIDNVEGDKKLIGVAKALEKEVKHPIAQSILTLPGEIANVNKIKQTNVGIEGVWNSLKVEIKAYPEKNATTNIGLYIAGKAKLIIRLKNTIKPYVVETIKLLKQKGIEPVMITGDHEGVALSVAKEVGIDSVYFGVAPAEKAKVIAKLQKQGKTAFVGDGFNDTVAMKKANVSIAFATGSDITNSLADISILQNDFTSLVRVLTLSKMNNRGVRFALTYAFTFNTLTIPIAFILLIAPWVGASLMALSDILVAMNAWFYKRQGHNKLKKLNEHVNQSKKDINLKS